MVTPRRQSTCLRHLFLLAVYIVSEVGAWRQITGQLNRIFFDGVTLLGLSIETNRDGNIWVAETDIDTRPNWHALSGECDYATSQKGNIWCVDSRKRLGYAWYGGGSDWVDDWILIPATLTQVTVFPDVDLIYVTNELNELWFANKDIAGPTPNWKKLDTEIHHVRAGIGHSNEKLLAMVDTAGAVHVALETGAKPDWKFVRKDMITMSFDGKTMCGVDLAHNVQFAKGPDFRDWTVIEGSSQGMFRYVECHGDKFWAIGNGNANVHFIDLKEINNATDPEHCIGRDKQCTFPLVPCCNTCLFANPTRDTKCRKHTGQDDGDRFSYCLPWRCSFTGDDEPSGRQSGPQGNTTKGRVTEQDLSWMTPEQLANERKGAVIARDDFQKYMAAHRLRATGKPKP